MKKISFLKTLYEEDKLKIIKPNEEVKEAYLKKSDSHLNSAKILYKNKKLEEAVSLSYYSMFYSLLALFFKIGIKCENHTGAIILLKEIFKIDNKTIIEAKKERIDKQYYVDFEITKQEVNEMIRSTEMFTAKIDDFISRLTNENIENFRKELKVLLKLKAEGKNQ